MRQDFINPYLSVPSGSDIYPADDDSINYEEVYSEVKMPEANEIFLANWPWLRDLVPNNNIDHDDDNNNEDGKHLSNERKMKVNAKLHSVPQFDPLPTPLPYIRPNVAAKVNHQKKNTNQNSYMSLCHFKICNMGRKRNTRYLHLWNMLDNMKFSPLHRFAN